MPTIDSDLIQRTVVRIRRTLDRRFERNPELYVSRQEAYEIKQLLRNNNLTRIKHYFETRRFSPEILGLTILKNLWLMSQFNRYNLSILSRIFNNCNIKMLREYMEDIVMDRSQVNINFKRLVEPFYCKCLTADESRQMLDNRLKNRTITELCLRNVMDSMEVADLCYHLLQTYLKKYPYLWDKVHLLDFSTKTNHFKNKICDILLNHEVIPGKDPHQFWINGLITTAGNCFDRTAAVLETLPPRDKGIRKLLNGIIAVLLVKDKQNREYYTWGLKDLYNRHEHLRFDLIFCCQKIMRFHHPTALRLVDIFRDIGIPAAGIMHKTVKEIKEGKITDIEFQNEHDLFKAADTGPKDNTKRYFIKQFLKNPDHKQMYVRFLNTYGSRSSAQDFAFDILNKVRRPYLADLTLDYFKRKNSNGYEHRFLALIRNKKLTSHKIAAYLEENHFEIYKELFDRN